MNPTIRFATLLALATAVISGTNNFLTKIAVTALKDPVLYTTLKNTIVALLLIGIVVLARRAGEVRGLSGAQWMRLLAIGAIGGSIPFALYFTGLAQTTAINAGLIHKTLFVWVMILAIPFLKERVSAWQFVGIAMIFSANFLIGGFKGFPFNAGELMILGATILWAVENIIAKKALKDISSTTVAASRMIFGSLILLAFISWRGGGDAVFSLSSTQWMWTLLTSALLTGYVLTWYTALKYAPATYVATLLVPATLVTNILSALFITHAFSLTDFASTALYIVGASFVILFAKRTAEKSSTLQTIARAI